MMAQPTTDAELLGPMIEVRSPAVISNPDANNLIYWVDSYLIEFSRCQSATRRDTTAADLRRIGECVAALRARTKHFAGIPELDRPKYHPEDIPVKKGPQLNRVENADVQHIVDSLVAIRVQLGFMDSAERATGLSAASTDSKQLLGHRPWRAKSLRIWPSRLRRVYWFGCTGGCPPSL